MEISRLKRENKELKEIIGIITYKLHKHKKIRIVKDIMKSIQNKTKIAKKMGISRTSLYYKPKRDIIDLDIKGRIEEVLSKHKSYGHKRKG